MNLREIVRSPAVTCGPDATVVEAVRQMDKENVGSVIVVQPGGGIVGIVTDRDVALRGMGAERSPGTPVSEIMTTNVVSLPDDANIFDAARQMAARGCRRLPVLGIGGALTGVVSLDDLILLFARQTDSMARAIASETVT